MSKNVLIHTAYSCLNNCRYFFVESLPLVAFKPEDGIPIEEALQLIESDSSSPLAYETDDMKGNADVFQVNSIADADDSFAKKAYEV